MPQIDAKGKYVFGIVNSVSTVNNLILYKPFVPANVI